MKRTPWYPVSTPPARRGWFEYNMADGGTVVRFWWSGWRWQFRPGYGGVFNHITTYAGDKWRGLAEQPK